MNNWTTYTRNNRIIYKNYTIDHSKKGLNKVSIFDLKDDFYGDYKSIIEAKNLINKGQLLNLSKL